MDNELPANDAHEASQEENLESLESDAQAMRDAQTTIVNGASADKTGEEDSMPGDMSESGQTTGDSEDSVSDSVSETASQKTGPMLRSQTTAIRTKAIQP